MFPIKSCFKWGSVKFRADAYERTHFAVLTPYPREWGFFDYELARHLERGAQVDGVRISYEMVHPDARRATSNDMCFFNDDSLPFIDNATIKHFADILSVPFTKAGATQWVTYDSWRDHPGGGPCSRGTIPDDTTGIGNPRTDIVFDINFEDAEAVANAMEEMGYDEIPPNKTVVEDIRRGLEKIADHKAKVAAEVE